MYSCYYYKLAILAIKYDLGRPWYLSIVGGPGVATINISESVQIGAQVSIGSEIASFRIGSTCCIDGPLFLKEYNHAF